MTEQEQEQAAGSKKRVPLRDGIFTMPVDADEPPKLLGCRCPRCGDAFVPARQICLSCGNEALEAAELGPRGELSTFTIARQRPPGALVEPPFAIGQVKLEDGPTVQSLLTEADPEKLEVGMKMEAVLAKVGENEDGDDLVACKFRPL